MNSTKAEPFWGLAGEAAPWAIKVRRQLHQHPELGFHEVTTSHTVSSRLAEMGLRSQTGLGGYGVKAVIYGDQPGPVIALRADMDALPIQEETGLPYASQVPGVMHACGHDVHTAVLLGTAKVLSANRQLLPGSVVLLFQPAEEVGPGGAKAMIDAGALKEPKVDEVYGLHVQTDLIAGDMAFGPGPRSAASDSVRIIITGKGGHGARPHTAVDPIPIAAQVITALQQIVSRQTSPADSAVVTIGTIHAGTAGNIIPAQVEMTGTVRTMDSELRQLMPERIQRIAEGISHALGAECQVEYRHGYPVLINDVKATEKAKQAAIGLLGPAHVHEQEPTMGAEDFAYFLQQVPGNFGRLGAAFADESRRFPAHNSKLELNEECIRIGIAYFLSLVLGR